MKKAASAAPGDSQQCNRDRDAAGKLGLAGKSGTRSGTKKTRSHVVDPTTKEKDKDKAGADGAVPLPTLELEPNATPKAKAKTQNNFNNTLEERNAVLETQKEELEQKLK